MKLERQGKRIAIVLQNEEDKLDMINILRYYTHRAYPLEDRGTNMKMLMNELEEEIV